MAVADDADGLLAELVAGDVGAVQVAAPDPLPQASWPTLISRVSARIAPIVNSATAEALRPGALTTVTPRARAAAMSMLAGPPRETAISRSSGSGRAASR